jgi:hypothetical protein
VIVILLDSSLLLEGSLNLRRQRSYLLPVHGFLHLEFLLVVGVIYPSLDILESALFLDHQHGDAVGEFPLFPEGFVQILLEFMLGDMPTA